jgi:hypothetical protein
MVAAPEFSENRSMCSECGEVFRSQDDLHHFISVADGASMAEFADESEQSTGIPQGGLA